jgi:hypothetical protein
MPSVYVTWKGQCTDLGRRLIISDHIEDVGKLADALLGQSSCAKGGGELAGDGVADAGLFPADCVEPIGDDLVRVPRARVYGTEFRLSDPRDLYPGEDRVSFLFAAVYDRAEAWPRPEHNGVLVLVEDAEQCKLYKNPLIQKANFYLCSPRIHLRYFAETWMDSLLAFIRHFYMPELHYWRYADLPGADQFAHIDPDGDWEGRAQAWTQVKRALVEEAAEWVPKGRELRAMYEHVLRAGELPGWWLSKPYEPLALDIVAMPANEDEKRELVLLLIFSRAAFEQAAREAIFCAGKGLDLHHVPLHFNGMNLSLRTSLDPVGNKLSVEVRVTTPELPPHAIAADETAAPGSRSPREEA